MAKPNTDATAKVTPDAIVPKTKHTDYFGAVIAYLGVPDTIGNRNFLEGWAMVEGTKAKWNPLATSLNAPGATTFNSAGVKNYPDPATGAKATAETIKNYPNIVGALQTGSPIVGGITAGITHDFGVWVSGGQGAGTAPWQQKATQYTKSVWNNAQGDPGGRGAYSGFGIGNYPLGTGKWSTPGGAASAAASALGNDVLSALGLKGITKDILYISILLGGGLILIIGLVLIGADIGLAVFSRSKMNTVVVNNLPGKRAARQQAASDAASTKAAKTQEVQDRNQLRELRIEREQFDREHRATIAAEKLKQEKAKTSTTRAVAKRHRSRNKPIGGKIPF